LRIAPWLTKSGLPKWPNRPFDNHEINHSEQLLLSRQYQPHPRGDDHERITRARQAAEALFTAKPPVSPPAVQLIATADAAARKPRVLRIIPPTAAAPHDNSEIPVVPPPVGIPPAHVARIRTWVKYGMTVAQVAQVYGVPVGEIERTLRHT
jgi:hypothetical protein